MTIHAELKEHVAIAGRRLAKVAEQNPTRYTDDRKVFETACAESMPTAVLYDVIFGSPTLGIEPSGLTDRELLFARAVLAASLVDWQSKCSVAGQRQLRLDVIDYARRLAAVHTTQDNLALGDLL